MISEVTNHYNQILKLVISFCLLVSSLSTEVLAQRKCGTVEYQELLKKRNPGYEDVEEFEEWLKLKKQEKNKILPFRTFALKETVLQIPVVVHVVHNGEPYGVGSNIPDEQILSQIEVLNEDFRRLNADATETPIIFQPVAADTEIEFVLAKQDPEGLPTSGIVRVQGTLTSWNNNTDMELKSLSYWPAEDYLNMWVTTLGGGLLGYAQTPVSNLEGLEESSQNRLTDGIVMTHTSFGSSEKYPEGDLEVPYDLGRTTTHEVGHFLGLQHIWGECGCNCDDFVDDTPLQENSTNGCPDSKQSCGSQDMFQNYMDYTDDGCMNIFTALQKERMRIVMESSPRRMTLPESSGLNEPILANIDLGIKEVIEPVGGICTTSLSPAIEVRNYGNDTINSVKIEFRLDGLLIETIDLALTLAPLQMQTIVFNVIPAPQPGSASFEFMITEVNGIEDENLLNNTLTSDVIVPVFLDIPVNETFDDPPFDWSIINDDGGITWEQWQTPSRNPANKAMRLNFKDYTNLAEIDFLISPNIDPGTGTNITLLFDYAYAYSPGFSNDELRVAISYDCGKTFDLPVFDRKGISLATTSNTSQTFIPSERSDWKRESINLNLTSAINGIQVAFIGVNGGGNNLYIDNIELVDQKFTDAGIASLVSPEYRLCAESITPVLTIENLGTEDIQTLEIIYSINNGNSITSQFSNLSLQAAESTELELDPVQISAGLYDFDFQVLASGDIKAGNDGYEISIINSCEVDIIPLRETFDDIGQESSKWMIYDRDNDGITWKKDEITESSVVFENYEGTLRGLKDYLFSPILDLTTTSRASMFFDVSYASDISPGEILRIKVSKDMGLSFEDIIYEKSGEDLAINETGGPWIPFSESDWIREFITLNEYTGGKIIIAFEATGMKNNNLYIDNLEFYADDDPEPLVFTQNVRIYPNPSIAGKFNMTFNLMEKEDLQILIYDVMGSKVLHSSYFNVLNQTYPFDLTGNMDGIYFIKTIGKTFSTTQRIFINP